jgi:hypothetical protein
MILINLIIILFFDFFIKELYLINLRNGLIYNFLLILFQVEILSLIITGLSFPKKKKKR